MKKSIVNGLVLFLVAILVLPSACSGNNKASFRSIEDFYIRNPPPDLSIETLIEDNTNGTSLTRQIHYKANRVTVQVREYASDDLAQRSLDSLSSGDATTTIGGKSVRISKDGTVLNWRDGHFAIRIIGSVNEIIPNRGSTELTFPDVAKRVAQILIERKAEYFAKNSGEQTVSGSEKRELRVPTGALQLPLNAHSAGDAVAKSLRSLNKSDEVFRFVVATVDSADGVWVEGPTNGPWRVYRDPARSGSLGSRYAKVDYYSFLVYSDGRVVTENVYALNIINEIERLNTEGTKTASQGTSAPTPPKTSISLPTTPSTPGITAPAPTSSPLPTPPPTGGKIIFTSTVDGNSEIYVIDEDGKNRQRLTRTENEDERDPVWSPDGKKIAFMSGQTTPSSGYISSGIFIMDANGNNRVNLTKDMKKSSPPNRSFNFYVFSPDSTRIAFSYKLVGDPGVGGVIENAIYVMNNDGSQKKKINSSDSAEWVLWSPDGKGLAWGALWEGMSQVGFGDWDTTSLFGEGERGFSPIALSPNAPLAVYSRSQTPDNNNQEVLVGQIGYGGKTIATLLPDRKTLMGVYPRWSPNGKKLAFLDFDSSPAQTFVFDVQQSTKTKLTDDPSFRAGLENDFVWSPDAEKMLFSVKGDLYVIATDGSGSVKKLTSTGMDSITSFIRFPSNSWIRFSSDTSPSDAAGLKVGDVRIISVSRDFNPHRFVVNITNTTDKPVRDVRVSLSSSDSAIKVSPEVLSIPAIAAKETKEIGPFVLEGKSSSPAVEVVVRSTWTSNGKSLSESMTTSLPNISALKDDELGRLVGDIATHLLNQAVEKALQIPGIPLGWLVDEVSGGIYNRSVLIIATDDEGNLLDDVEVRIKDKTVEALPAVLVPSQWIAFTQGGVVLWTNADNPLPEVRLSYKGVNAYANLDQYNKLSTPESPIIFAVFKKDGTVVVNVPNASLFQ